LYIFVSFFLPPPLSLSLHFIHSLLPLTN
jgi:hypothetical protein